MPQGPGSSGPLTRSANTTSVPVRRWRQCPPHHTSVRVLHAADVQASESYISVGEDDNWHHACGQCDGRVGWLTKGGALDGITVEATRVVMNGIQKVDPVMGASHSHQSVALWLFDDLAPQKRVETYFERLVRGSWGKCCSSMAMTMTVEMH